MLVVVHRSCPSRRDISFVPRRPVERRAKVKRKFSLQSHCVTQLVPRAPRCATAGMRTPAVAGVLCAAVVVSSHAVTTTATTHPCSHDNVRRMACADAFEVRKTVKTTTLNHCPPPLLSPPCWLTKSTSPPCQENSAMKGWKLKPDFLAPSEPVILENCHEHSVFLDILRQEFGV